MRSIDVFLPVLYFAVQKGRWRKMRGTRQAGGNVRLIGSSDDERSLAAPAAVS